MPELIKDLGLLYHPGAKKRVRFAIYICPFCKREFKGRAYKDLSPKSSKCKSCACSINAMKHGNGKSRIYKIYKGMLDRCHNPKNSSFMYYGGKGVFVCQEWANSYEKFFIWASRNGYSESMSIDRIDVKCGYSPENCKWIPLSDQPKNRGVFKNNTSGFKGVSYMGNKGKYRAYIGVNSKVIYLGLHETAELAASAYNRYVLDNGLEHPINDLG